MHRTFIASDNSSMCRPLLYVYLSLYSKRLNVGHYSVTECILSVCHNSDMSISTSHFCKKTYKYILYIFKSFQERANGRAIFPHQNPTPIHVNHIVK